jgi:SnoaL-like polyketide cyclase
MIRTISEADLADDAPDLVKPVSLTVDAGHSEAGAVPDLTRDVDDLLIAGNKVAVRLRLCGHFTRAMDGLTGTGQEVDLIALPRAAQHARSREVASQAGQAADMTGARRCGGHPVIEHDDQYRTLSLALIDRRGEAVLELRDGQRLLS